jgi:hypothetical protein
MVLICQYIVADCEQESALVLQKLDPQNAMHKLFRAHQRYTQGQHIKVKQLGIPHQQDLSLLDRDLKKVLVLDIRKEGFSLQPHNGLVVRPFQVCSYGR